MKTQYRVLPFADPHHDARQLIANVMDEIVMEKDFDAESVAAISQAMLDAVMAVIGATSVLDKTQVSRSSDVISLSNDYRAAFNRVFEALYFGLARFSETGQVSSRGGHSSEKAELILSLEPLLKDVDNVVSRARAQIDGSSC